MELKNKNIAIFVAHLFEDLELWYPKIRMIEAGAHITVIGPKTKEYKGKHGLTAKADKNIEQTEADDFDCLIIPGGYSPDYMRRNKKMIEFVRKINNGNKLIATICHGAWLLASAEIINGKTVTSFHSIIDDLKHAGANWVNKEVVIDGNILTSRNPNDLPAFCQNIIASLKD